MRPTNKKLGYCYFGDFNEIVERLRLLIASHNVGIMNHNEILSILDELEEAEIIQKKLMIL